MSVRAEKGRADALSRLMVWVLIWRLTGAAQFVELLGSQAAGVNPLAVTPELLFAAPVAYLLVRAALRDDVVLPAWRTFLLFEGVLLAVEWRASLVGGVFDGKYGYGVLLLYAAFLALVNAGISERSWETVRRAAVSAGVFMSALIILSWLTPLDLDFVDQSGPLTLVDTRLSARRLIHPNQLGFALGIAMILIMGEARRLARRLTSAELAMLAGMLVVVVMNASRSGFLLAVIALGTHLLAVRGFINERSLRGAFGMLLVVLAFSAVLIIVSLRYDSLFIVNRFEEFTYGEARMRQIYVTWVNFLDNPVFGRGHYMAGQGVLWGYVRSNFNYTQVLAAYGIVGFTLWAAMLWQMFVTRVRVDRVLAVALCLAADNWAIILPIAVLAYENYYERKLSRREAAPSLPGAALRPSGVAVPTSGY